MVSDAVLLLIALTGLSATILFVLFFAGYFRGLTARIADAADDGGDEGVVKAGGRRVAGGGGLAALRKRKDKKKAGGTERDEPARQQQEAAAAAAVARAADVEDHDGDAENENDEGLVEPRALTKKELQKEMKKREREEMRQFEEARREELKKKNQAKEEALQKKREDDAKLEQEREAEEKRVKEEKEKKEQEEFDKWKDMFVVEEEGSKMAEDSEESQSLLQQFVDYIKNHKVVLLEDLASEFSLTTQDAIQRVEALQASNRITGIIDDRGKFIYITEDEMEKVGKYIQRKGRMSLSELSKECNKLIRLEGDVDASCSGGAALSVDWLNEEEEIGGGDQETKEASP